MKPDIDQDTKPSSESPAPSLANYFSTPQWVLYAVFIVGALLLRWIGLDERPYHHDESLHGMYGRYFYDFPDQNYYRYDPMLHGPMLYNLLRVVYSTIGYSDFGARSLITLIGTFFLFLPLIFRRFFSRNVVLALTAAIAFSPTIIYWSRFLREDFLVLGGWFLMLYGCVIAQPKRRALFVLVGFAIQLCTKENSFVNLALLLGYLMFEGGYRLFLNRPLREIKAEWITALTIGAMFVIAVALAYQFTHEVSDPRLAGVALACSIITYLVLLARRDTECARVWASIRDYPVHLILGFAIAAFIYVYLYSAGFRHADGILDGLYRKSIGYWIHHHSIERIAGPFLFHFYLLSWYELPFVLAVIFQMFLFYREAGRKTRWVAGSVLGLTFLALVFRDAAIVTAIWKFFKLKDGLDLIGLSIFLVHPVLVTLYHLNQNQRVLAFFGYFFTANLFTYSYLGEKVPWLSMYPLVSGVIYLALYFQDYFMRHPIANIRECSSDRLILRIGTVILLLGLAFTVQEGIQKTTPWFNFVFELPDAARGSAVFLASGVSLIALGILAGMYNWLPRYNLAILLLVLVSVWNFRAALLTNFVYAGHAREYISQVHTTPEFHKLMHQMRFEVEVQNRGFKPTIYIKGDGTWPSTWYLRDIPEYKFTINEKDRPTFDYIIQDWAEPAKDVPPGFKAVRINLRGWWVPDFKVMTLRGFLNYALNHTPWNSPGYQYVNLLVKE